MGIIHNELLGGARNLQNFKGYTIRYFCRFAKKRWFRKQQVLMRTSGFFITPLGDTGGETAQRRLSFFSEFWGFFP